MLRHVSEQMLAMVTDPEELQAMLTRQPGVWKGLRVQQTWAWTSALRLCGLGKLLCHFELEPLPLYNVN